jgi:hypothetical protein
MPMGDTARQDEYDDTQLAPFGVGGPAEVAGAPSGMGSILSGGYQYLDNLAKRAFGASEEMRAGGAYNPAPAVEAAMLPMMGGVAGTGEGGFAVGAGPIKAYHSSPHDFEKFDLSKIGTGEGAQVYGHGLYFAENPVVSGQGGQYWKAFSERFKEGPEGKAVQYLRSSDMDRAAAIQKLDTDLSAHHERVAQGETYMPPAEDARYAQQLMQARDLLASGKPVGPRTYEVNINADPAHFLDWDKPLKEQAIADKVTGAVPRDLRDVFEKNVASGVSGSNVYHNYLPRQSFAVRVHPGEHFSPSSATSLEDALASVGGDASRVRTILNPSKPAASDVLREAGIPGIKYLDQGSRTLAARANNPRNANWMADDAAWKASTPTSNYVVFNPAIIDIMKKYGLAGATTGTMGALAAQDEYSQ